MPSTSLPEIYLVAGTRTVVGSPHKSLKQCTAVDLGAAVVRAVCSRSGLLPTAVEEVIFGNVVSAGTAQNIARQVAFAAGVGGQVPAYTVNNVCGSALQAVIAAAQAVRVGDRDICVAGGTESVSHSPFLVRREAKDDPQKEYIDSAFYDGLFCRMTNASMGVLVEGLAARQHISREDQDRVALLSHQRACAAQQAGWLRDEIVAVKQGDLDVVTDDRPRAKASLEKLAALPPAFLKEGTVTAGNACAPCDGAAAVMVASAAAVKRFSLTPQARIVSYASVAVDPRHTFESDEAAITLCLKKAGLTLSDIDLFDIAEAFAASLVYTKRRLSLDDARVNRVGGDIAFGHPTGAAGARILVTAVHTLLRQKARRALVCVSFGSGGGLAVIIERAS